MVTKTLFSLPICYSVYNLISIFHLYTQNAITSQELHKHLTHRALIESNREWIKFRRPEDESKYMIVWLFYQLDFSKLKIIGEIDLDGIKCTTIELQSNRNEIKDKLSEVMSEVPFGLIKLRNINEKICLDWYTSSKLPINQNVPKIKDKILLDLKSILLTETGYQMNLNDEWSTNKRELFNNIKLTRVNYKSIILEIPTPNGVIEKELKQGQILEVDY